MEAQTLPSKAQVRSHGSLLRELQKSDEAQNSAVPDEDLQQLKRQLSSSSSDIKVSKPNILLESFLGLKEIKKEILSYLEKSASAQFSFENGDYEYNDRILIFGETGTGKTHLVRAIATELKANLIEVGDSTDVLKWESNMDLYTKALHEMCIESGSATTVLFLDNLDVLCTRDEEKRAMIRLLRGVQFAWAKNESGRSSPSSPLIIFASTNKPNLLDEKVIFGFDQRIYVPVLNLQERKWLFQRMIQKNWKLGHTMTPKDVEWVARRTYGILTSEIEMLVDKAVHVQYPDWSLDEGSSSKDGLPRAGTFDGVKWRALEVGDFIEVLRGFLVLDSKTFFEFETFQKKFGNGPFMRMYEREDNDENAPVKKGKNKRGWLYTAIAWI